VPGVLGDGLQMAPVPETPGAESPMAPVVPSIEIRDPQPIEL